MHRLRRVSGGYEEKPAKELPNWGISALYNDRQLIRAKKMTKYFIPFDSAPPRTIWKLFLFHDSQEVVIDLDFESTLLGREAFCDVNLQSKSVSRQHCVIQFRDVCLDSKTREVIPYLFDLSSKFGTFLNDCRVQSRCFVELQHRDKISFGRSNISGIVYCCSSNESGISE